jgi:large subunit ribosomal protein L21
MSAILPHGEGCVKANACLGPASLEKGEMLMYAVIETGGKQYRVEPGQLLRVEKLDAEKGGEIFLERVLMLVNGTDVKIGSPIVEGARVRATVIVQDKARKIIVFKYKPKKRIRTKTGHRQPFTEVRIEALEA